MMIEIDKGGWNEMLKFLLGYENLVLLLFFFCWIELGQEEEGWIGLAFIW
jgi:hypothetical protein